MKIHWKKVFYFVFLLGSMFGFKNATGQNDSSILNSETEDSLSVFTISGRVFDKKTKEPIPFCNVIIVKDDKQFGGTTTDYDGAYLIYNIPQGNYNLHVSFIGYETQKINNLFIVKNSKLNIFLEPKDSKDSGVMCYIIIQYYKTPLIDPKNNTTGETIDSEDIKNMPIRR